MLAGPEGKTWPAVRLGAAPRERALAKGLFERIQTYEQARDALSGDAMAKARVFAGAATPLRTKGGYYNLLLADTCHRLALLYAGRAVLANRAALADARAVVASLKLPLLDETQLKALLVEDGRDGHLPAREEFDYVVLQAARSMNSDASSVRFQGDPAGNFASQRTAALLETPSMGVLAERLRSTDLDGSVFMPVLIDFIQGAGNESKLWDEGSTETEFARVFKDRGGRRVRAKGFDNARVSQRELLYFIGMLRSPGIGSGSAPDRLYSIAVDPPPAADRDVPTKLTVTEREIGPAIVPSTPVSVSSDGSSWAYREDANSLVSERVAVERAFREQIAGAATRPTTQPFSRPSTRPTHTSSSSSATTRLTMPTTRRSTAPMARRAATATTQPTTRPAGGAGAGAGYVARAGARLVVNGVRQRPYADIRQVSPLSFVTFSPDGKHYAFVASKSGVGLNNVSVVVDGTMEGPTLANIDGTSFAISNDGLPSYLASQAGKGMVVARGKSYGPYASAQWLATSKDGKHVGWVARAKLEGGVDVVIDGKVEKSFRNAAGLVFSPDGKRWAVMADLDVEDRVTVIGGENPQQYRHPGLPVGFTPDGKHLVSGPPTTAGGDGKTALVIDGSTLFRADERMHTPPTITADGKVLLAGEPSRLFSAADGKQLAEYDGIATVSPDGKRVVVRKNARHSGRTPLGGSPAAIDFGNDKPDFDEAIPGKFSPAGHYVFMGAPAGAINEGLAPWHVIVDGRPGPACAQVKPGFGFSADGRHVAAAVRRGLVWRLSVDGQESDRAYDYVVKSPTHFTSPSSVSMLAVRGDKLYEVTAKVEGKGYAPPKGAGAASEEVPPAAAGRSPTDGGVPASGGATAGAGNWKRSVVVPNVAGNANIITCVRGYAMNGMPHARLHDRKGRQAGCFHLHAQRSELDDRADPAHGGRQLD